MCSRVSKCRGVCLFGHVCVCVCVCVCTCVCERVRVFFVRYCVYVCAFMREVVGVSLRPYVVQGWPRGWRVGAAFVKV